MIPPASLTTPRPASWASTARCSTTQQEGYLETFRPYALPSGEWIDQAARNLARLLKKESPAGVAPA